ncbi:MAG: hypothetical protein H6810_11475 [Phycisphaeraceae bacterium]|nr:MAG: hypothetical protein H6810_11475 [Phycisphaeraceae bacterium]
MRLFPCARLIAFAALAAPSVATGQVDLEFRALTPVRDPGETAQIGLYAVAGAGSVDPTVGAVEVVFSWDDAYLTLLGVDAANPANLIFSGFPVVGSNGLNESNPPADGDGLYIGLGPLGTPIDATAPGTLIAILNFESLYGTPGAAVDILTSGGTPARDTIVYDGETPNTIVTGMLSGTSVAIRCGPFDAAPPYGLLDLADVNVFATAFLAQNPLADQNNDGIYDLVDINLFVTGFLAGCATPP